ncbi:unnamed protein product [Adineta steineri]|uniref:EF-hand domain-containing protein n=1 Tax=Adineta steineri TaxID=433720 RepID=A0A819HF25_9BILA|nr:unnamed protein product [Adineta steineri]
MAGITIDTKKIKNNTLVNHEIAASNRYSHRQAPSRLRSVIFRQDPLIDSKSRPLTFVQRLSLSLVNTKTFTINEFGRLFQLTSLLTKRILIVFNLNESYEKNSILGDDIIRLAHLLWISGMPIKAFILFKLFDSNDKDIISINDIRSFYEQYLSEVKYFKDEKRLNEVVDIFLQGFFPLNNENQQQQQQQELNFEQFHQILQ